MGSLKIKKTTKDVKRGGRGRARTNADVVPRAVTSFRMKDRRKFEVFDMEAHSRSRIEDSASDAERKFSEAGRRMDGDRPTTCLMERMGRPIQVGVFIDTLRRLNPTLHFELAKGDPTKYGVYRPAYPLDQAPAVARGWVHICGMESGLNLGGRVNEGVMPEFSYTETSEVVVPEGDAVKKVRKFEREIRGWRTVLAALYTEGLISEAQIESTFRISQGRDSANWRQKMHPAITVNQ